MYIRKKLEVSAGPHCRIWSRRPFNIAAQRGAGDVSNEYSLRRSAYLFAPLSPPRFFFWLASQLANSVQLAIACPLDVLLSYPTCSTSSPPKRAGFKRVVVAPAPSFAFYCHFLSLKKFPPPNQKL